MDLRIYYIILPTLNLIILHRKMKRIEAKNKKRPHKKTGPKREFNEFQLQVVRDVVGKFGGTQNDLAMLFGKNRSTIEYWVKNYANFRQAYQNGKLERGVEYARKLDHLAMGYSHKDTKDRKSVV